MVTRLLPILFLLLCTLSLSACDEISPIVWSPDGNIMALLSRDGLRLADANGQLSEPLLENVTRAAWLSSNHLLAVTNKRLQTWDEAINFLTAQQQKEAITLAHLLKQQILLHNDNDTSWGEKLLENCPAYLNEIAILYLKNDQDTALKKKLAGDQYKILDDTACGIYFLNLIDIQDNHIKNTKALWHGFRTIKDLRISPDQTAALLVLDKENGSKLFDILLISLDFPRAPLKVAESFSAHASWSANSKEIYIVQSNNYKDSPTALGSIAVLKIRDNDKLPVQNKEAPIQLLYSAVGSSLDLISLKDGHILFAAPNLELPATERDIPNTKNIFSFKIGEQPIRRLMSKQDAEDMQDIDSLQANPAGTWVAAYNTQHGNLNLLNINTGEVIHCQAEPQLIPNWRNSEEICFIKAKEKQPDKQHVSEAVLLSVITHKEWVISDQWPKRATNGLLSSKK